VSPNPGPGPDRPNTACANHRVSHSIGCPSGSVSHSSFGSAPSGNGYSSNAPNTMPNRNPIRRASPQSCELVMPRSNLRAHASDFDGNLDGCEASRVPPSAVEWRLVDPVEAAGREQPGPGVQRDVQRLAEVHAVDHQAIGRRAAVMPDLFLLLVGVDRHRDRVARLVDLPQVVAATRIRRI